jgi:putative transposase
MREVVNAIFYVLRGGISWRMLPLDFPHWKTVYHYFREWRISGLWKKIHDSLRARLRETAGRNRQPSAAILDSQSVKAADTAARDRGYDAGKKITGRKRHILVDTLGLLLVVVVHSAATQDWDGARDLFKRMKGRFSRLRQVWADSAYGKNALPDWLWDFRERGKLLLEVVKRPGDKKGFSVLPKRWIVERTFGWLMKQRRLVRDYEYLPETSETFIYLAMTRLMLTRLSRTSS